MWFHLGPAFVSLLRCTFAPRPYLETHHYVCHLNGEQWNDLEETLCILQEWSAADLSSPADEASSIYLTCDAQLQLGRATFYLPAPSNLASFHHAVHGWSRWVFSSCKQTNQDRCILIIPLDSSHPKTRSCRHQYHDSSCSRNRVMVENMILSLSRWPFWKERVASWDQYPEQLSIN